MRHMVSIGIGNCIGGVHRCGTWPASVSSSSGTEPSTRRMLWHGRRWRQRRRLPSMWHLASIGIGIGGIHQCGTWPASVSSSSGTLGAKHALAWPVLASASTTSTRRWAVGVGHSETARCCVRSTAIASRRREAVRAHLGSVDAANSTSLVARRVASLSRRRDAAVRYGALEGPPAIIHLPRGRPGGAIGLPRGVSSAGGLPVQSVMHGQSLRGRGFHCRPTHCRRQPKPAGGTCSSRGAANVLARKPCSEPRPHSCTACLAGSLWCVHHRREWKTSVGCPSEISIDITSHHGNDA